GPVGGGCTAHTEVVSLTQSPTVGDAATGETSADAVTPDGRYVVFSSIATNIYSFYSSVVHDQVYVRDRVMGTTEVVSKGVGDTPSDGGSFGAAISDDGRYVVFQSDATNLTTPATSGQQHVFVRDRCLGALGCTPHTDLISVSPLGAEGDNSSFLEDGASGQNSISGDGRYVMFVSLASNIVGGDINGQNDVFVRDRCLGAPGCIPHTDIASVATHAMGTHSDINTPSLSANGRIVTFTTTSPDLAPHVSGFYDVFTHDLDTGI